jgi:uncharacterized protein DUF1553/uncharacterized protein DUF1549
MRNAWRSDRWLMLIGSLTVAFFCQFAAAQEDVAETPKAQVAIDATPLNEPAITDSDRQHWSFSPIVRPRVPVVARAAMLRTPIDAFIADKLAAQGGSFAREASKATLIRRLSLDLRGVPPTPAELLAFEADDSPDADERLVDRLLASPQFGERYAQHWLDVARFADSDGYEHDKVRPDAWRYRDWVIAALNADMPYDAFIRLQLAGDENRPSIPTMFCLAGPDMPDINDQLERRHSLMNEMTASVGAVFLGLQFGCAQCHNHKYDPVSQGDFYRLRAILEPAVPQLKRDVPVAALVEQKDVQPARFWVRGDHRRPGVAVAPGFPRIADSTGRTSHSELNRADLAHWLTSPENPLTARVMANRLWQWHFGRGICATPSDFGVMGAAPTHPKLLDWLARELRDGQWSMKRMHRLMVSSATYRHLYAHFPRQRLSGEAIRDSMLAAAGLLSSERGGAGIMPPLPGELLGALLKGQWNASQREADHYKRSVYVFARRNLRYPIFEAFDRPDGNASCPVRGRSTTAPQSLLLFNSEFSLLAARHLAARVLDAEEPENQRTEEPNQQILERLYLTALSRRPTADETATLEKFLQEQRDRLASEGRPRNELALPIGYPAKADAYAAAALVDACLAILNSNEFIYID